MGVSPEGCALVWPDLRCRQGSAQGLLVTHGAQVPRGVCAVGCLELAAQRSLGPAASTCMQTAQGSPGSFQKGPSAVPGAPSPGSPPSSSSLW